MKHVIDAEGKRLPIKLDATSNGEFVPVPLSPTNRAANRRAHEAATENAKRLDVSRRRFLISACGAATALLAFNSANAAAGKGGGFFEIEPDAAVEPQLAQAHVGGKGEFIFDVQGHFVDPTGAWVKTAPADAFKWSPKASCEFGAKPGARSYLDCLGPEEFVKDVFLDSDTDMMVLSFVPSARDAEPLTIQAADAVRRIVDKLEGTHRLLLHGRVNPNQPGDLEGDGRAEGEAGASARGRPTRNTVRRRQRLLSVRRRRHLASSRRRARSASRTSASTKDCRSARSPMSTASAATSASSPSAIPT